MKKGKKNPVKPTRLTSPLYLPIDPQLKEAVELVAWNAGMTTNEWVAMVLADKIGKPHLAPIPRKRMGRPPQSLAAV